MQDFMGTAVTAQVVATLFDPSNKELESLAENVTEKTEEGKEVLELSIEFKKWKATYTDWGQDDP